MYGAARIFACGGEVELGGKRYKADGARLRDYYGEAERHILSLRPDPLVVARRACELFRGDQEAIEALLRVAFSKACELASVTFDEYAAWSSSIDGVAFLTWCQVHNNAPELSLDEVRGLYLDDVERKALELVGTGLTAAAAISQAEEQVVDRAQAQLDAASGEDFRGNSTGSPA